MEHDKVISDFSSIRQRFENNTSRWHSKVKLHVGASSDMQPTLASGFDFAYIDGSHQAKDVLEDAILCWRALKPEGILVFDDYGWNEYREPWLKPRLAINAFLQCLTGWYQVLYVGYQVAVRKLSTYTPPAFPQSGASEPR